MEKIKSVLVIGTGLIGGSLALNIKAEYPDIQITALEQNSDSLQAALAAGAVDKSGVHFRVEALRNDVIIFCTPVKETISFIKELETLDLKQPVLVTDVGSTKAEIVAAARELKQPLIEFVGGHPMAGSHKSGFIAADVDLFENAYYVLTPTPSVTTERVGTLKKLLRHTRAKFLEMDALEHDKVTGIVSHLPHVIASGLVAQRDSFKESLPATNLLAAGGFRDITRIASSDPKMWTDILLSNQKVLVEQLDLWQERMSEVKEWLITENQPAIFDFFASGKQSRDALPQQKTGAIPAFNDLFVELPDYAGEIAKITQILAGEDLSLTNLKILENREDIFGTLQLSFKHQKEVGVAKALLTAENYRCFEK